MVQFIDDHRADYGVEPIGRVLPIAPSTYYEQKAREADPSRLPARLVRDALEQALHARPDLDGLVHHSDRGTKYLSIRYTERLAEAGIEPSGGSVGDSYDNALAETIIGLFKTEVIRRKGPWRNIEEVEFATLEWVDWFNHRRLLGPIGDIPPVELEQMYYEGQDAPAMEVGLN